MALFHEDTVSGAALVGFGGAVTWLSLGMGTGAAGATLPPNFFPLICAGGLIICGLVLILKGLPASDVAFPQIFDKRVVSVAVMLAVFYWFFAWIDFRVGAWAFTVLTMLSFGMNGWRQLLIVPLVLTTVLYLAFAKGFGVVLPTWI